MKKYIPNIYITFWLVYFLQGVLYSQGGFVSQSVLVFLLLSSLYSCVYAFFHYALPRPLKILFALVVIWTIYGIIPILFGTGDLSINVAPFEYLKNIYMSLLPVFSFYVFTKKGWLTEDMLKRWLVFFIIVAISSFYKNERALIMSATERGSKAEEFTNGAGYIVLSILPLLPLFWQKPILQYVMMGVCMLYVLLGYKRGAIIAGALCSIWMVYASFKSERNINSKTSRRRNTRLVLTLLIIMGAVATVQYLMSTSDYFTFRLQSTLNGYTSERDDLYGFFSHYYLHETNLFEFLFGLGANGTLKIYSNVAHNDWLEIAIDNGFFVLVLYVIYWTSLIKAFWGSDRKEMSSMILGMFIIIYFLRTFFSFSYSDIPMYSSCALGFALACYHPRARRLQ